MSLLNRQEPTWICILLDCIHSSNYVHPEAPGFEPTRCPGVGQHRAPILCNAVPDRRRLFPGPFSPFLCAVPPSFHYMFLPWNFLCTRHIIYPKDHLYSTPTIRKLLRTCDVQRAKLPLQLTLSPSP